MPEDITFTDAVAVDTEAMGLHPGRDRLCVVQLSAGDGDAHLVKFSGDKYDAPNLCKILTDPNLTKIFHFARFDLGILKKYLGIMTQPVYCTKIASRIARTYTDQHGFKDLCSELLHIKVSKHEQSSDWGSTELTEAQIKYAANDVLYLHDLKAKLDDMLEREGRKELLQACFDFLPARAELDLAGWAEMDIFHHKG